MLKVTVGTSMNRKDMLLPENTTLEAAIVASEITPTSNESFTLNGTPLKNNVIPPFPAGETVEVSVVMG